MSGVEAEQKGRRVIIACRIMEPELTHLLSEKSKARDGTDIVYLEQDLHRTPDKLRVQLQEKIDQAARTRPHRSSSATGSAPKGLRESRHANRS